MGAAGPPSTAQRLTQLALVQRQRGEAGEARQRRLQVRVRKQRLCRRGGAGVFGGGGQEA